MQQIRSSLPTKFWTETICDENSNKKLENYASYEQNVYRLVIENLSAVSNGLWRSME